MGPCKPHPFSSTRADGCGHPLRFDLQATLEAVVGLSARVPEDAFTAQMLGTERKGSGVLIHERGLVLTIGDLVCEAEDMWLRTPSGRVVPAHAVAYDFESGFGLVQAHADLGVSPVELGRSADLQMGARRVMAAAGGVASAIETVLVARREFAGSWEYLLDEALFVAPAHADWGGAALLDSHGQLVGIGSLMVQSGDGPGPDKLNMAVPIDLLPPILDDLVNYGRRLAAPAPWLGLDLAETDTGLVVVATALNGPARRAGIEAGDRIFEIAGVPVAELADFYRQLRALGPAGVRVPLRVLRGNTRFDVALVSADRTTFLRPPRLH